MNRAFIVAFILAFLFLLTCPGYAATLHVDASVAQSGDGQTCATAFNTVQEGIDAASDGDTVMVAPGVYIENIDFHGKNIVLTSTDPLDPDAVAATVIDGNQAGSVVTFAGTEQETCVLSGFTIRNGKSDYGGGISGAERWYIASTHVTIVNNIIAENSAEREGAGLFRCDGLIRNNVINDNSAISEGGGLALCSGIIEGNRITENYAGNRGGGLARCQALIQDNTIRSNHGGDGGGLYGCDHTIRDNVVTENTAASDGAGGLAHCDGLVQNNIVSDNGASGLRQCDGIVENNCIVGNPEAGFWDCDGIIQGNIILGNYAGRGDGGGLAYCDGMIQNNMIARNAPGMHFCAAVIRNNTIVDNRRWGTCMGTTANCIIWGNGGQDGQQIPDCVAPTYCCIQNWGGGGQGNIAEDPRFVDPDGPDNDPTTYEDNDYRLLPDSPCIDAGFNHPDLPAKDIAGMRRIMYGGKNLTVDMGAYEYYINELTPGPGAEEATLTWSSIAGSTYVILYSENLLIWILAEAGVPSAGNQTTSWIDDGTFTGIPPSLAPRRFYRVLEYP